MFELIARHARALCGASAVLVTEFDGTLLHMRALDGGDAAMLARLRAAYPRAPAPDFFGGRAVLTGDVVHLRDIPAEAGLHQFVHQVGEHSGLGVPLRRDEQVLGAMVLSRSAAGGFDEDEVALIRSFADQAVIALSSAATLRELRARTAELAERNSEYGKRIEQQAATIDVLQAMSASPGDARPVFDLIVERARSFSDADMVSIALATNGMIQLLAQCGLTNEHAATYMANFPRPIGTDTVQGRTILTRDIQQIPDNASDPSFAMAGTALTYGIRSHAGVPLLRGGEAIGALVIARKTPGNCTPTQMELLRTFAEQAVIAISAAETYRALQERTEALARRNSEYGERTEHQSATIDVLKAMSASPGETQPVFDLIVRHALHACNGMSAALLEFDGELVRWRAASGGDTTAISAFHALFPLPPSRDYLAGRAILDKRIIHVRDIGSEPDVLPEVRAMGGGTTLSMPLLRDGEAIGAISLNARDPGGFTDSQVALLQTFAEQAVIAIGSAATYRALHERTAALAQRNTEYGQRIEHQAATIDVLKVMSAAAGNEQPVLELIARRARELCDAETVGMFSFDGEMITVRYVDSVDLQSLGPFLQSFPRAPTGDYTIGRCILERRVIEIDDADADPGLASVVHAHRNRSIISLPFTIDDRVAGGMSIAIRKPEGMTESQKALSRILAEQAVIAITSAETYRELQERTAELTRSVSELQALQEVLRAVNSSLDLETVLATIISRAVQLSSSDEGTIYEYDTTEQVFVPTAAFGMSNARMTLLRDRRIRLGETHLGRSAMLRTPVAVEDVQQDPEVPNAAEALPGIHAVLAVPLLHDNDVIGGLVIRRRSEDSFAPNVITLMQTFAGQAVLAIENARLFQDAGHARAAAETALADLRRAQDRLVQSEKMASLGQLTAGIAHEIKNPLNFVNNFAELSADLLDELHAAIVGHLQAEIDDLTATLKGNLEKIAQHGRRADSIVKNMLLHSRSGPSEYRTVDLNATVEEALNLAYHGARAETPGFNITLERELDPHAGLVEVYPQELTRVMLNLISNGFYAARKRAAAATHGFEPVLRLTTRALGDEVEIRVRDNGTGISPAVRGKIFEPFFTTKPAGEGTGLGLSLSYDIIVKQHGGKLTVDSEVNEFTEFRIILPRAMAVADGGRA